MCQSYLLCIRKRKTVENSICFSNFQNSLVFNFSFANKVSFSFSNWKSCFFFCLFLLFKQIRHSINVLFFYLPSLLKCATVTHPFLGTLGNLSNRIPTACYNVFQNRRRGAFMQEHAIYRRITKCLLLLNGLVVHLKFFFFFPIFFCFFLCNLLHAIWFIRREVEEWVEKIPSASCPITWAYSTNSTDNGIGKIEEKR